MPTAETELSRYLRNKSHATNCCKWSEAPPYDCTCGLDQARIAAEELMDKAWKYDDLVD